MLIQFMFLIYVVVECIFNKKQCRNINGLYEMHSLTQIMPLRKPVKLCVPATFHGLSCINDEVSPNLSCMATFEHWRNSYTIWKPHISNVFIESFISTLHIYYGCKKDMQCTLKVLCYIFRKLSFRMAKLSAIILHWRSTLGNWKGHTH